MNALCVLLKEYFVWCLLRIYLWSNPRFVLSYQILVWVLPHFPEPNSGFAGGWIRVAFWSFEPEVVSPGKELPSRGSSPLTLSAKIGVTSQPFAALCRQLRPGGCCFKAAQLHAGKQREPRGLVYFHLFQLSRISPNSSAVSKQSPAPKPRPPIIFSNTLHRGFPRGSVVQDPPANAGDTGSIPGLGRSHVLQGN